MSFAPCMGRMPPENTSCCVTNTSFGHMLVQQLSDLIVRWLTADTHWRPHLTLIGLTDDSHHRRDTKAIPFVTSIRRGRRVERSVKVWYQSAYPSLLVHRWGGCSLGWTSQVLKWYLARNLPVTPVHPVRSFPVPVATSFKSQYLFVRRMVCVEGERARGSDGSTHSDGSPGTH
jgi:hypothetical protein